MKKIPTYDLAEFKELFPKNSHITVQARKDALKSGFSRGDVEDVIHELDASDFYKSMPAEKVPGLWQDVYKPKHLGITLYVKLQISGAVRTAVVVSFKEE
jgi:hypothetical protein